MKNKLKMISLFAAAALSLLAAFCLEQEDDEEKNKEYATLKINTERTNRRRNYFFG